MRLYYVVLVFLLYITLAKNTGKHTGKLDQIDTRYANLHETCKINDCKELGRYENMNCIHECISEKCYSSIYRDEPLEPGEIDTEREDAFISCAKKDIEKEFVCIVF